MKFICDDRIPFLRGVLEPYAEVLYLPGSETTPELVRDAAALVTRTRTACNRELLEGSQVRAIATATIGFDHIDTQWCEESGIRWANAPGCNSGSVMQYLGSVLAELSRMHGFSLGGKTLGVVGVGNVGSKVARLASSLGMRVLCCDPPRARREGPQGFVNLDALLDEADIVTLHVPLQREGEDATWHLFDAQMLSRMRPDQFLVNSSRGPVVDNKALLDALKKGKLAGAVLDVWEGEPAIDLELMGKLDIATPHIAGYSADGKAAGTAAAVRMLAREFDLPLTEWSPCDIPAPQGGLELVLDAAGRSDEDVICDALLATYDIMGDCRALKSAPESFEYLRGHYPVRREYAAYAVQLKGGSASLAEKIRNLGFGEVETS